LGDLDAADRTGDLLPRTSRRYSFITCCRCSCANRCWCPCYCRRKPRSRRPLHPNWIRRRSHSRLSSSCSRGLLLSCHLDRPVVCRSGVECRRLSSCRCRLQLHRRCRSFRRHCVRFRSFRHPFRKSSFPLRAVRRRWSPRPTPENLERAWSLLVPRSREQWWSRSSSQPLCRSPPYAFPCRQLRRSFGQKSTPAMQGR
jgi:hypothetical protein